MEILTLLDFLEVKILFDINFLCFRDKIKLLSFLKKFENSTIFKFPIKNCIKYLKKSNLLEFFKLDLTFMFKDLSLQKKLKNLF